MKLIVGLGNPGGQYKNTRHNIGFLALDFLAKEFGLGCFKLNAKFKAKILEGNINNIKIILAKPQTYMNASGEAIQIIANFYKIETKDIIIIHDELDLPFAKIRVREDGSAAGHNGIKSIMEKLGTDKFIRVRIGVRNKKTELMPADKFVLSRFSILEKLKLKEIFEEVKIEVEKFI